MTLTPFKYLRLRSILALTLVLTLSSMLSSITALSLLSFHRVLSTYMGEGENIIVIYDARSRTPFTGLVPAFLAERIMAASGVLACSPEVIVPCIVRGEPVFLRGVLPEEFQKISNITIINGEMLNLRSLNFAIVGKRASERIGLKVGDKILTVGVLSSTYLELQVKGIFRSGDILEDEIIAPLHVGQWLRGARYSYVTIIRVKVSGGANIREAIINLTTEDSPKPSQPGGQDRQEPSEGQGLSEQPIAKWAATHFKVEDIGVKEAERFMKKYIESYGITRETILILSVVTLIFSGAAILLAAEALISQHSGEIEVLRSIGASRKLLRRDIMLKVTQISLLASALGTVLAIALLSVVLENFSLQILFHSIQLHVDALAVALTLSTVLAVTIIGIWRSIR